MGRTIALLLVSDASHLCGGILLQSVVWEQKVNLSWLS